MTNTSVAASRDDTAIAIESGAASREAARDDKHIDTSSREAATDVIRIRRGLTRGHLGFIRSVVADIRTQLGDEPADDPPR